MMKKTMEQVHGHRRSGRMVPLLIAVLALCVCLMGCGGGSAKKEQFIGEWLGTMETDGGLTTTGLGFVVAEDGSWAECRAKVGNVLGLDYGSEVIHYGEWDCWSDTITLTCSDEADLRYKFKISPDGSTLKDTAGDLVFSRIS